MQKGNSTLSLILFFAAVAGVWFLQDWYFGQPSQQAPEGALEEAEQRRREDIIANLVPLRGEFLGLENDTFLWELTEQVQTDDGVAVNRTPRNGRLVDETVVYRLSTDGETSRSEEISPADIEPGEPVIVFIRGDQTELQQPDIWQIVVAR
ncbi:MAG TPA: hypothetical protein VD862_00270 [Candidatus Paceibacterota bacterium]|nr:hypothetical protein [Candidatus Paceibacterota bacterium]